MKRSVLGGAILIFVVFILALSHIPTVKTWVSRSDTTQVQTQAETQAETQPLILVPSENQSGTVLIDLQAPETVEVGQLVVIDVSASEADDIAWVVEPKTTNFRIDSGGRVGYFTSNVAGQFTFAIAAAKADKVALSLYTITVGDPTPIKPDKVRPLGFAGEVFDWTQDVQSDNFNVEIIRLSQSFRTVASMIGGTVTGKKSIIETTSESNRTALSENTSAWRPFIQGLRDYLNTRKDSLKTDDDHKRTWLQIADALEFIATP